MDETVTSMPTPATRTDNGDEILIRLMAEGDQAALGMLYEQRGRLIYSLVYRMLGDAADAEEVTQDVFLRVWNNAGRFDAKQASALGWVVAVARHMAIDRMRSRAASAKKKERSLDGTGIAETVADGHDDPSVLAEQSETAAFVMGALDSLGDDHRRVIDLSYYEGLSHSKIAERIGAPLGTVKTRIRSAIDQLRNLMGHADELR